MILTNARLVLPDQVVRGTLTVIRGLIAAIDEGSTPLSSALDLDGDWLIPGIVDLHTDNLERQAQPRVNARWPSASAFLAHDAQCAVAGITTVLDALCVGDLGYEQGRIRTLHDGVADADALAAAGLLRADHWLHLRCELPAPDMQALFAPLAQHPRLRLVSLMDHTPGFGQYAEIDRFRALRRLDSMPEPAIDAMIADQQNLRTRWLGPNRAVILESLAGTGIALASHDDRLPAEVAQNGRDGIAISEFPVSLAAARAARACGMGIIAGAPNIVRGGSHSGNIAVRDLLAEHLVDALASDYVPSSLLEAAFAPHAADLAVVLPGAVARITATPAAMAGLPDRGRIARGLRADLVQVHSRPDLPPIVRRVWRGGVVVA